jgi:hypothetical protein
MSDNSFVASLTGVASNGNVTQIYPPGLTAGVTPPKNPGQSIRRPCGGYMKSAELNTGGSVTGTLEIYDIDGLAEGADVSSAATITNAQLVAAIAAGTAKLIYDQTFGATIGSERSNIPGKAYAKGLAMRFVGSGTLKVNLTVDQCGVKTE